MNLVLIIGGAWLLLVLVAGVALSRVSRNLNQHIPLPGEAEDADAEPPDPDPDHPA